MSAAEPLHTPSLAEQALAAWDAEAANQAAALAAKEDRETKITAAHLERTHRAIDARLGRTWLSVIRSAWTVERQVAEPLHHSVDLVADEEVEGVAWGLRYVSEIDEPPYAVRLSTGGERMLLSHHEYNDRLVLVRPCPDDPAEWREVGWDLKSVMELGRALREPVPPCGDHDGVFSHTLRRPDPREF